MLTCTIGHHGRSVASTGGVRQPFNEVGGHFTIKVNRYLLPIATATQFMKLSLSRLAEYWGLPSPESEIQTVFDEIKQNYYQHGEVFAFS